jgi:anti-anti-sigma factor
MTTTPCAVAFGIDVAGHVVSARGELDLNAVSRLRHALQTARRDPRQAVVVDLVGVVYLDSPVVSVLFEHADRLCLRLAVGASTNRLLSLTGLLSLPGVRVSYAGRVAAI